MRVLHFVPWANYGGVERSVLNLCVATSDHNPAVLFESDGPILADFLRRGISCYVLENLMKSNDGARELQDVADSCVLLHIHGMEFMPNVHELARKLRLPCIFTLQARTRMPQLDCPLVCVSDDIAEMQEPGSCCLVICNGEPVSDGTTVSFRPP